MFALENDICLWTVELMKQREEETQKERNVESLMWNETNLPTNVLIKCAELERTTFHL